MISNFNLLALPLSGVLCAACGSTVGNNQPETETRTVSSFTKANVNDGVEVTLTVESAQSGDVDLEVTAESNLLSSVVTSVSNDTLSVGVSGSIQSNLRITVTGTVADISDAQANNGSRLEIVGIDGETLSVGASNGASLTAEGTVDMLTVGSAGGATVNCGDLEATTAEVGLDNGASAIVCVSGEVTGAVTNGASLTVLCGGDASGVNATGGGTVN